MKGSFVMPQFTTHVYQARRKTNPSSIISFQRQSRILLQKFSLRISVQRYDIIQCSALFFLKRSQILIVITF